MHECGGPDTPHVCWAYRKEDTVQHFERQSAQHFERQPAHLEREFTTRVGAAFLDLMEVNDDEEGHVEVVLEYNEHGAHVFVSMVPCPGHATCDLRRN